MQFCDYAKIFVASGRGGDGCISFRREKNIPFGGPDGGNGGRGGDVVLVVDFHLGTLSDLRYRSHYRAKNGCAGQGRCKTGASGEDLKIRVPAGTEVWYEDVLVADLVQEGQTFVVAKGGKGGLGNTCFVSSTDRAPRKNTPGGEAQHCWIQLKLKLLADWGLIGFPNAGKSTLISVLTQASPKIADYPFTTLTPQLGVYTDSHGQRLILADLPGLIENAHQGKGLGHRFLAHGERCRGILHLVDSTLPDPFKAYDLVRKEMLAYHPDFSQKKEWILFTKRDQLDPETQKDLTKKMKKRWGDRCALISAHSGENLSPKDTQKWFAESD